MAEMLGNGVRFLGVPRYATHAIVPDEPEWSQAVNARPVFSPNAAAGVLMQMGE